MKLHFPIPQIRNGLEELKTAKTVKPLYEQETGSGFWLVGDQGVYLMPNTTDGAHNAKSEKPLVIYAKECDPNALPFDTWWDNKRASFGGDDGVDFIARAESAPESAPDYFMSQIELRPAPATEVQAIYLYGMGIAYERMGDMVEAVDDYRGAELFGHKGAAGALVRLSRTPFPKAE